MKNQTLFSSKDKSKKLKFRLLQFLFGALRVNCVLETDIAVFGCYKSATYYKTFNSKGFN